MKRRLILSIIACGASLALGTASQAQLTSSTTTTTGTTGAACPAGGPGGPHHGMLEHLTKELSLTGSQQQQVATILEQSKPQFEALHQDTKAKFKTLVEGVASQITPLLTADQQAKFAKMTERFENGPAFGGGPGGPGGKGGPGHRFGKGGPGGPGGNGGHGEFLEKMTSELGLSTDQQAQIKTILDAARTQAKTIRENTSLDPEQKKSQLKDVWQGVQGQVNGILTADQQQKLAALKAAHHHQGQNGPATTGTNSQ